MNPLPPANAALRFRAGHVVLLACFILLGLSVVGVTGYFRLSSETAALRSSLMSAIPGTWNKKITIHVGGITMALLRNGLRFVHLQPEPRAAIEALRGAEVGISELREERVFVERAKVLSAADKAMAVRGWDRVVGVAEKDDLVAVYMPRKGLAVGRMKCCVMVLHGATLVIASARGNIVPLLDLSRDRLRLRPEKLHLALR